jgi:hypothetical protein
LWRLQTWWRIRLKSSPLLDAVVQQTRRDGVIRPIHPTAAAFDLH